MREIKFKAIVDYDDNANQWVYGGMLQQPEYDEYGVMIVEKRNAWGDLEYHTVIPETLCQFTGLKDKNGKEIYENDIVKKIEHGGWGLTQQGIIIYSKDAKFVFLDRYKKEFDLLSIEKLEFNHGATEKVNIEYEVVGNIFDNPIK